MTQDVTNVISPFTSNMTLRWSCRRGDFLIWFRLVDPFAAPPYGLSIVDVWEIRDGDFVTITNRVEDLPSWFELHPTEVCDSLAYRMLEKLKKGYQPKEIIQGPNIWRLRAGDRLAWVGKRRSGIQGKGHVLAVLDISDCALAIGETNLAQSVEEAFTFGSLTQENQTADQIAMCHEAVRFVGDMGAPRTFGEGWALG